MDDSNKTPDVSQVRHHKELEELFISRFEKNFSEFSSFGQLYHPLEDYYYGVSGVGREPAIRSNQYRKVLDLMRRHRVFDRCVFDSMPLQQISQFKIYSRSFFSRKKLKIVVAAASISPLEDLVKGQVPRPMSLLHLEETIKRVVKQEEVFYYLGIASTSGWEGRVYQQALQGSNWMVGVLEPGEGTYWRRYFPRPDTWYGLEAVFDPEMDTEKLDRAKNAILRHSRLRLKGGHVLIEELHRELDVPDYIFVRALEQAMQEDRELEFRNIAGKKILQRRRL